MASGLSKASQLTAVGEGLSIGCLELGYSRLSANKMRVEFAFQRAWRDWPHAARFPRVCADLKRNDIYYQIMDRSAGRRGAIAYWEMGSTLVPVLVGDDDLAGALELLAGFYGVSAPNWIDLARAFADDLTI